MYSNLKAFRVLWRGLVLVIYLIAIGWDVCVVRLRYDESLAPLRVFLQARLFYFTYWNMILQIIYNVIAILNEFYGTNKEEEIPPPLRSLSDYIFSVLAFPASLFVTSVYWTVYAINDELAFPIKAQEIVPSWVNHVLHTSTFIFVLYEILLCYHKYPSSRSAHRTLGMFIIAYFVWISFARLWSGIWIYPVLKDMEWWIKWFVVTCTFLYCSLLYSIGEFINSKIWKQKIKKIDKMESQPVLEQNEMTV